jgi:hypothetical protein
MLNVEQLRDLIIKPALSKLQLFSDVASELLVFTCAVESDGGTYLKQLKGPALGIYQMEPATYNDIWQNYLRSRHDYLMMLGGNFDAYRMPSENRMVYDLCYATAMARLHYRRCVRALPEKGDIEGIWQYYKDYWNTEKGKAKKEPSLKKYQAFLSA